MSVEHNLYTPKIMKKIVSYLCNDIVFFITFVHIQHLDLLVNTIVKRILNLYRD